MMKHCLMTEAARDTEWMKNAMSVSSLNLAQRGKQGSNVNCNKEKWSQHGKKNEIYVEIPRAFSPKTTKDGKPSSEFSSCEKDSFSKETDFGKCPEMVKESSVQKDVHTSGRESPSSEETEVVAVHDIEIDTVPHGVKTEQNQTASVQNTSTEVIKDTDTKRAVEKGLNAGTGLTGDHTVLVSRHKQRNKLHNKLEGSSGVSGVCIVPRRRKEFVTGMSKSLDAGNSKCEMNIAVRQQYYDRWARAKRGRGSVLDYQTKKKQQNENEDIGKAMARYREQRRLKAKQEKSERSPEPETSTYEILPSSINSRESITKLDQDWIPISSLNTADSAILLESKLEESGSDLPRVDIHRLMSANNNPATENMIDSVTYDETGASFSSGKTCHVSQPLLEPFTYDKKEETEHSRNENSHRREFDSCFIPALKSGDQTLRRSKLQSDTDITIDGSTDFLTRNGSTSFLGKKYRLFKLPTKSQWKNETDSTYIRTKPTFAEKENIQLDKIPLVLSKKTPVFTEEERVLIDMQNRRLEENLSRVRARTNDSQGLLFGNNFDNRCRSANSTNLPEKQTPFCLTNTLSGKFAQLRENSETLSPVCLTMASTNPQVSSTSETSHRVSIKPKGLISKRLNHSDKWSNVGPQKRPLPVPVPMCLRGESAKTYDHDEKFQM